MATLRSSFPSRLRQLLSSARAISPSIKPVSDTPPEIQAFIDKVILCPLQDIEIPLSGFRWEYNKGNFNHWRPLFLHFDTYFKAYISGRNDLLLADELLEGDAPFSKQAVLQILRVMQIILDNCHNKGSFRGLEHFKLLLASTDPEILIASLETLSSLVKISSKLHLSGKLVELGSINSCLLSLAQGWGRKEEGLGLYACVMLNEKTQEGGLSLFPSDVQNETDRSQYRVGSTLYLELHNVDSQNVKGSSVINIPDLHLRKEDDLSLMELCIKQYKVPPEHRHLLLSKIRYAHSFWSSRICRLYSRICLLAFGVLVQASDSHNELVSFLANEPEYTNELIRIVKSDDTISVNIRTLAMHALGSQLAAYSSSNQRAAILSGSSISFTGGNRMILLNVLQRAILSLNTSNDPSSIAFVEAFLQFFLLHVISMSSSRSVTRGAGIVPTFLPLLEDSDMSHMHLVFLALKTLQKLMDYSNSAMTLFKDLGGVELLINRLQMEVDRVINATATDDKLMNSVKSSRHYFNMIYSQKRLIRVLLKALGSVTFAPANTLRSQNSVSLPSTLSLIFKNTEIFEGDIYSSAVAVMSEIIHKDPTCFPVLDELGLPDAFLSSVVVGILPSSKALMCVPNGLGAICLNAKGLEAVKKTTALRFLVEIFTNRKYILAMSDAIVPLANAIEELLRHVSSLKSVGVDLIIEIINKISLIGDSKLRAPSEKVVESTSMETDTEDKKNRSSCLLVGETDPTSKGVNDEQFIQLSIFHVMVLVHRTTENSETCRLFVERSGIEALLKLLLRPSIAQSSEGMSIAFHSTMVFKGFTQHHSAPLARAFCSSLKYQLKKALTAFDAVAGSFLLDPKVTPDSGIFSSLFLVEFLLFLGASKDSRWVTALLTEFGNDSKNVLEDIGCVQREVLWQVALLEDAKLQIEDDDTGSGQESLQSESGINEFEDQRVNSFRQFLDPLLRRRTPGWNFESQIFDLINMYRDLTRASGLQQREGRNGTLNLRLGASQHLHQPGASVSIGSSGKKEDGKQKSYYSSCCNTVKSLSSHITRLFQELGKAMCLPSRRRGDLINVSSSSKSVASIVAFVALNHMSFGGHVLSGSEASVSVKCRYFGKVIDFIDGILLDKPESCNPVMLNALYGRGVVQSVWTTFEATSQLLFAVNRTPASPMDTDEGILKQDDLDETDHSWIHGSLASYGKLMDHLVTSSFILVPSTKHLLTQSLVNGDIPFPRDAETLVKVLQSKTLKVLLPVWTHPQFTDCNHDFVATVVSIIRHIYSGVELKNVSNALARPSGPPPNETTISTIVEMGFSRPRAEEALRQVRLNSVELAMEWLFSHPEEVQEDDELARALVMSLGSSESDTREDLTNENSEQIEEEVVQLPPVVDLLSTCRKLLHMKDSLAFPVRDLLLLICSRNDGEYRSIVISYIIEQVKLSSAISDSGTSNMLASLFHVIALILNEDVASREVASMNGLVKVASGILSGWISGLHDTGVPQVPKWVTAAFVAIDRLAQVDQKLSDDILELLKNSDDGIQRSVVVDDEKPYKTELAHGLKYIDILEQKRLVEIACSCLRIQLPSETTHAVLQLCSSLTRNYSVALRFLDAGGLPLVLSLPSSSMFVGFDNVAAAIIRHILEDPQTLQQAMEHEIKHSIATTANRQSNGRLTPHNFLLNLTSVISRDPVIFLRAAQSVCQVEMVNERPYIVLLKDREKDKVNEKGKEKERGEEKDKSQTTDGRGVHGKPYDINSKNAKVHRKPPQSFVNVIELLLDSIITFFPMKNVTVAGDCSSSIDMDIDVAASKGKGKAIASAPEEIEVNKQESSASAAKIVFIMKLLTEILLKYGSSVYVLLRKDAEVISCRSLPRKGPAGMCSGGIFHHILHEFLPCSRNSGKEKKIVADWRHKLASKASQFLVATCVRSTEARKRVFMEIGYVFKDFIDSSEGFRPPESIIQAFVDLLNEVLVARTPTGSCISAEASVTFIDLGLVRSITRTLHVLDLDHGDSSKVASGIVKILEVVTREHVRAGENNTGKGESSKKPSEQGLAGRTDSGPNTSQATETMLQTNVAYVPSDHVESINTVQIYGGSEDITDDMEHDQDYDGGSAPPNEDDYMHETSDDARGLQTRLDTVGIRFEIQTDVQENLEENDGEDMSGDDGEEDDEDGDHEEHNGLEDEVAYLPHPDTDQDDHEIEDEFDEEVMEEDDDEDDDDEDEGLILRLGDGMNGINMFDHIEAFGGDQNISSELHVMPVDVFGSRRQGRTTSIYNLLGRTGDSATTTQHPLLGEPASSLPSVPPRRLDSVRDILAERNSESSSLRMNSIFRSLRTGRHAHPLNLWADDNQQSGGSNASAVPQGLEDLLVSRLTPAETNQPLSESTEVEPHSKGEANQPQQELIIETAAGDNRNSEINYTTPAPSSTLPDASASRHIRPAVNGFQQVVDSSHSLSQSVEMQFEHSNAVGRDVEGVSLAGSEATVGDSLRGLDVEIGSADGHDDAAERQGQADTRTRRVNMSFGNTAHLSGTDVPPHGENPSQEADQAASAGELQNGGDADSRSIDPAFLDALPEELRAEVLSAQQGQIAQPSNTEPDPEPQNEDIDPEFLAALPPDIREEVLAQQQAQRSHQSHELEGQPVEMDTVSIIATFPSELREEVLLTSSDAILANLTPALVAEANMLRERFAHRYNRTLFGMHPRNLQGESSRRGNGIGSILDRTGGVILRRSLGSKAVEADGAPLVDTDDLKAMIRLLRVVQPLYKGQLQRLLLNLCAHNETRIALVKILMEFLMLDMRKPTNILGSLEPSYRLYACQSHVAYSRPQYLDGVPPLVSRRVLETLTYLARSHPFVAKLFFQFSMRPSAPESSSLDLIRGKAVMVDEDKIVKLQHEEEYLSITLLLSLFNQPLYLRSIAHLEQLLHLLDVIIDHAESKPKSSDARGPSSTEHISVQITTSDAEINTGSAGTSSGSDARSSKADDISKLSVSELKRELDSEDVLRNLPQGELRFLCSLLAREGLSDKAYALVAEVLKKLVAIVPVHCHLFISELAGSIQNLTKSAMNELHIFGEFKKVILPATFSDGAAVLRVLQALSSLVAPLSVKDKNGQVLPEKEHAAALSLLWSINAALDPLWLELSTCVGKIERYSDSLQDLSTSGVASTSKPSLVMPPLPAGSQNILPYLESFFVTCEKLNPMQSGAGHDIGGDVVSGVEEATTSDRKPKTSGSAYKVDEKQIAFIKFSDKHRKLLNAFIRQNPGLLEKSFSLMLKVPRVIDFDNKRAHFRSKIKQQHDHLHHHGPLRISVRRAYILEDSYNQLRMRSTQDLKGRLTVHFQGEEGIDAGGLTREWYQLLSRVIFDKGALLFTTVGNESTFQPNPNSVYQTEHLSYFKFVGRVVAKALFDGQLLDVHFTRSFYKHILGVKVTYHDIEAIDPDYFKNLKWMLENDISDILDLTFSIDADEEKLILYERAQVTDYELCENGRNIRVTEENKHEYVDLVAEHRLTTAIRPQINAFMDGFNELIQRDLISIFNDKELELLISGLPDIDLDDMRMNTEYSGYIAASPVIQWFWEVVQGFSKEDKARLLQFVTGTSKVPLEGFSALQGISGLQKFQIHKAYGSPDHLPSAHTCFNQLDLPEYPSKQHLEERLLLAIHEANEGFGFG